MEIDTPHGPARAHLHDAASPRGVLVLGHGAGGGIAAKDIVEAKDVALAGSLSVALVEQPYRVAGRRSPPPAPHLDTCWLAVVEALRGRWFHELPLVVGGRSSGARVACRTAHLTGAAGVICLAFPLQPPQERATHASAKPAARARHRAGRGAHRSGRERSLRDPTWRAAPHRLPRAGRPQPAPRPCHRSTGRCRMAAAGRRASSFRRSALRMELSAWASSCACRASSAS